MGEFLTLDAVTPIRSRPGDRYLSLLTKILMWIKILAVLSTEGRF
jgi:hypothetical protein